MSRLRAAAWFMALLTLVSGCGDTGGAQASPDRPAATGTEQHVPLRVARQGHQVLAFVPVTIKGHGPLLFALDTGASDSVVDKGVATELGLRQVGRRDISGVVGQRAVPLADVGHWQMGNVRLPSDTVAVVNLPGSAHGGGLQGLVGSDVLSTFGKITIDYQAQRLTLPAP